MPPEGDQDVVSDIQFGIATGHNDVLASSLFDSAEGVDGLSASFGDEHLNYRSIEQWFYLEGGSMLDVVEEEDEPESGHPAT